MPALTRENFQDWENEMYALHFSLFLSTIICCIWSSFGGLIYLEHLGIHMESKCFDWVLIQFWDTQDEKREKDLWTLVPRIKEA